jgi:hypothetical protein
VTSERHRYGVKVMLLNSSSSSSLPVGPLSFQQQRCWNLPHIGNDIIPPMAFRITGRLDPTLVATAVSAITERQSILRTRFDHGLHGPIQTVLPDNAVDFDIVDLSTRPEAERDGETTRLIQREAARPFVLNRPPLVRVRLVRLHAEQHVLFFIVHHIVGDLWSMKLLWAEFTRLYMANGDARRAELKPLQTQYIDYAGWQRKWFDGEVLRLHLTYLREWARDVPDFRISITQPSEDSVRRGEVVSIELSSEASSRIRQVSRQCKATVFMLLLAHFYLFLKRYTGLPRLLVAAMIANRPSTELEPLMGVFSTSLALRLDLSTTSTIEDLIAQTRDVCLDAYANQYLPLWQLSELTGQNLDSRLLRPRIAFTLETAPVKPREIDGLQVTEFACSGATIFQNGTGAVAAFDQAWEVWERASRYTITIIYRPLFSRSAVEDMLKCFVGLIESSTDALANSTRSSHVI